MTVRGTSHPYSSQNYGVDQSAPSLTETYLGKATQVIKNALFTMTGTVSDTDPASVTSGTTPTPDRFGERRMAERRRRPASRVRPGAIRSRRSTGATATRSRRRIVAGKTTSVNRRSSRGLDAADLERHDTDAGHVDEFHCLVHLRQRERRIRGLGCRNRITWSTRSRTTTARRSRRGTGRTDLRPRAYPGRRPEACRPVGRGQPPSPEKATSSCGW